MAKINYHVDNIHAFLKAIASNNNRLWFQQNKSWYEEVRAQFEDIVKVLLVNISEFDESVASLDVKDCVYRFYRDVRFSLDKSPYKRHMGAYISAKGKKSLHGGYYFHLQPGENFIAGGTWYLPSNILKEVRMSIYEDLSSFRDIVEEKEFKRVFPTVGYEPLKTMPKGFPKDFEYPEYLRVRLYCCGNDLPDDLFDSDSWLNEVVYRFKVCKPFIDFINDTIDDYE